MNTQAYPSTSMKKIGWLSWCERPTEDTPENDIDYYDVLILEPTSTRKERIVIIQLSAGMADCMGVSGEALNEFCDEYKLLTPNEKNSVYYFDNVGDFGDKFSAKKLFARAWGPELPMQKFAREVKVPVYVLAEKLDVFHDAE